MSVPPGDAGTHGGLTAGNLTRGICPVGVPLERGGAPVIDSGEVWRSCRPAGEGLTWKPIPVAE